MEVRLCGSPYTGGRLVRPSGPDSGNPDGAKSSCVVAYWSHSMELGAVRSG